MRHVAAYLLAALGGNANPSASDIKGILSSVGVEEDEAALKVVIDSLSGKDLEKLIAEGTEKLATMPAGGGAAAAAPAAASGGGAAPAAAAKEEKKEEPEEESDDDMGMGLFD